jgi:hypothetical protein
MIQADREILTWIRLCLINWLVTPQSLDLEAGLSNALHQVF